MRELTHKELADVAGGLECTIGYPHGFSCTLDEGDLSALRDWWCDNVGWWCDTRSTERAINDK